MFACFCRVFSGTYENARRLCDLFRFLTASTDFLLPPVSPLPLPSCLAASYLSQLPCRPSPQLCSVISCTFQMFYPHYSICLTPQPLHFLSSPTTPFLSMGGVALTCMENTATLLSCCVAGLCLLACYCISSRQSFHLIFNFS